VKLARSPITWISGCPEIVRSGSTTTRPTLSMAAPALSASTLPSLDARTPAAHSTVRAGMRFSPPSSFTVTPPSSMSVTRARVTGRTQRASSCRSAFLERSAGKPGSTRSSPSISRIRASAGLMCRKSCRNVSLAISPNAPASSTPVGPPPTITKVSHAWRSCASGSCSACSKAASRRDRMAVASSTVFRPGASGFQLSWPK